LGDYYYLSIVLTNECKIVNIMCNI
jgi:hypothetical protein